MAETGESRRALRELIALLERLDREWLSPDWLVADDAQAAEGIRAAIIDKDKNPQWKHALGAVPQERVDHMRAPLGDMELNLTGEQS